MGRVPGRESWAQIPAGGVPEKVPKAAWPVTQCEFLLAQWLTCLGCLYPASEALLSF